MTMSNRDGSQETLEHLSLALQEESLDLELSKLRTRRGKKVATLCVVLVAGLAGCGRGTPEHVDVSDYSDPDRNPWTPAGLFSDPKVAELAQAVSRNDLVAIDQLVSAGVDVNSQGKDATTPLCWAFMLRNKAAFRRLLERGADANHRIFGGNYPLILFLVNERDSEWLELAMKYKADPNAACRLTFIPHGGETALFRTLSRGNERSFEILLKAGANINHRMCDGATPVIHA